MTTHETITDRLSEYVDGELDFAEQHEIERHLAACAECRDIVSDLRMIAARAAQLPGVLPDQDLWTGIAAQIGESAPGRVVAFAPRNARRFSFTFLQLAAAAVTLMVLSGALVYFAQSGHRNADVQVATAHTPDAVPVSLADPFYDSAVADLEEALEQGRDRLDPETIKVLEENLASIDRAIDQCRKALEADPANSYLNSHLVSARQRKLALLRRATALTTGS